MRSASEKKMFDLLFDEVSETLRDIEQRCLKLETGDAVKELQVIFRAAHNVKGASQLYGLTDFGNFVHSFEDLLTLVQKNGTPVSSKSIDILLQVQSYLMNWVDQLRTEEPQLPDTSAIKALMKAHANELKLAASNISAANESQTVDLETQKELALAAEVALQAAKAEEASSSARRSKKSTGNLRISSLKIDEVIQLIGEVSIQQGILWHHYQQGNTNSPACRTAVNLNQKMLKELYEIVLSLRMQSAETLFQRMERVARDLARDQKKRVDVQLSGADTPLDKTVIEMITDPMMHLVRNAIDHGLEDEKTRKEAGKPAHGKIKIHTQQDSGHVLITISDDGRGLDPQMILESAIKKNLVPHGTKMRDEEIVQLIFIPGFSTRDTVSEISGRGVGMDVVQKAIQQLGGRIDITSKKGVGTTFHISLPASLEIIEGLTVRVDGHAYVIPRQEIVEIIDLNEYPIEHIAKSATPVLRIRDAVIPVENLSDYVGFESKPAVVEAPLKIQTKVALITRLADRTRLALRIDGIISQQQIVVRPLNEHLERIPCFAGITILGNGEPAMILNTNVIGESYLKWSHARDQKDSALRGIA